jgi:aldose 1-epimerase
MVSFTLSAVCALAATAAAQYSAGANADGKYELSAEGIRATFIPYGASISNLWINDTHGIERDIVLGFDNASHYSVDQFHPHLGGVPGKGLCCNRNETS